MGGCGVREELWLPFSHPVMLAGDRAEKTQSCPPLEASRMPRSLRGPGCFPYLVLRCQCARNCAQGFRKQTPRNQIMLDSEIIQQ